MRILVTGTGRGGTTLLREVVIGLNVARFYCGVYSKEEDRAFFNYNELPEGYMTKLTLPNSSNLGRDTCCEGLSNYMEKYNDLHLVFSIRHPVDTCMSKIVRGQKHSDGGHKWGEEISADGTIETAIKAVISMHDIYKTVKKRYPTRVLAVKMEELILNPREAIGRIATFFHCGVTQRSLTFYMYNSNPYQFRDYGTELNTNQINLYEKWQTAYDGFFSQREKDIERAKHELRSEIKDFGYNI